MSHDIVDKFSTHLKTVLTRALCFAAETEDRMIEPSHLLWALGTQKGCVGSEILKKGGVKATQLRKLVGAKKAVSVTASSIDPVALHLSDAAKRVLEKGVLTANMYTHQYVGTEHLLSGLMQVTDDDVSEFFAQKEINLQEIKSQLSVVLKSTSKLPDLTQSVQSISDALLTETDSKAEEEDEQKTPALDYFGYELTSAEAQAKIDPVIGRDVELERLQEILSRRTKNNPLLVGEPGVGKTAVVEGLAKKIVEGAVPGPLQDKRIIALDLSAVIAGTMYRGEFEGRLRQIIEEVRGNEEIILFIDEIHTIVGAGSATGSMDAANILKPALARGEIRCIGATTSAEYKKHLQNDQALERRFQMIRIDEPDVETTINILQGIIPNYEQFHGVRITHDAIEHAARFADRFVHENKLPDKAIDLIDEAAASVRVRAKSPGPAETKRQLRTSLQHLREAKRQAVIEERFLDALGLKEEEALLRSRMEEPATKEPEFDPIDRNDIARIVSRVTGIPVEEVLSEGTLQREALHRTLTKHILGQQEVIEAVSGALHRAKTGVGHPHRPLASFMFLGPSGVGKTQLAKIIAEHVFHDPKNLIRLDMSEYAEGFTTSKLIGAPAGYVGYRDQANLTDRVRERPYSVVLFDEIEKAHRDVQNLLLQILEEGEISDATGRKTNFRHTIVVLTSNVGLERFERGGLGFHSDAAHVQSTLSQDLTTELKERFRPELMNRLDHVCVFKPLDLKTIQKITKKELTQLTKRLEDRGIRITIEAPVSKHVSAAMDPTIGAREVRRQIQTLVESAIAERISRGKTRRPLRVHVRNGAIAVTQARSTKK